MLQKGIKSVLIGVLINTILAVTKIISGIVGNSYALIADGIESTTDIFSSLIVWGGLAIASKPPDENHPYGHGKAESLAALVVAFGLLAAAAGIVYNSIYEILIPHHSPAPFTLFVLVGVILIKEFLFRYIIKIGDKVGSTALVVDAWHHRSDAITSAAAFIGILVSLLGGPGYEAADDWAALFASGIIAFNGIRMMKYALREIMDTASPLENKVRETARTTEGVLDIEKCYIRKSGTNFIIDIHIEVDSNISVFKGHEIAHNLQDRLKREIPAINNIMVHVEPHLKTFSDKPSS